MSNINTLVDQLSNLNILEMNDLMKLLEEKWGVSAASVMNSSSPVAEVKSEEKTSFDVILKESGSNKINIIKAVRELTGLGLKEAKDLVDACPKELKSGISKDESEEIKKKFSDLGATIEIK